MTLAMYMFDLFLGEKAVPADSIEVNLSLLDIFDYVSDSVRPLREGCCVLDARHVVCLGYTTSRAASTTFKGYVLQSSHPNQIPHQVDLEIAANVSEWILKCSCKAGNNKCKHIVACLLHLNRYLFN